MTATSSAQPSLLICLINMFLAFAHVDDEQRLFANQASNTGGLKDRAILKSVYLRVQLDETFPVHQKEREVVYS